MIGIAEQAERPFVVRVKRRRQDPSPDDLIVEALSTAAASASDPADSLAALELNCEQTTHKRRKFQLVATVADTHIASTGDLLDKLQSRRENIVKPATPSSRSAGVAGGYRQIRSTRTDQDAVQETFRVYDIVHEAADHRVNQLFRGPDEAAIMANYYPLVQSYLLQQQQHQENKQPQPQLPAQEAANEEFVFDYYALAVGDQLDADTDVADMPIIQVRDEAWWQGDPTLGSEADESEDSNAENWYGNDYPEDDEPTESEHSGLHTDDGYSSDD